MGASMCTKGSGTNSVNPPVSSCNCRMRRRRRAHHVEPLASADLVRAELCAHLVIEDFRGGARQRSQALLFQINEKLRDRDAQRCGALMHFQGRKRMDVN